MAATQADMGRFGYPLEYENLGPIGIIWARFLQIMRFLLRAHYLNGSWSNVTFLINKPTTFMLVDTMTSYTA